MNNVALINGKTGSFMTAAGGVGKELDSTNRHSENEIRWKLEENAILRISGIVQAFWEKSCRFSGGG